MKIFIIILILFFSSFKILAGDIQLKPFSQTPLVDWFNGKVDTEGREFYPFIRCSALILEYTKAIEKDFGKVLDLRIVQAGELFNFALNIQSIQYPKMKNEELKEILLYSLENIGRYYNEDMIENKKINNDYFHNSYMASDIEICFKLAEDL